MRTVHRGATLIEFIVYLLVAAIAVGICCSVLEHSYATCTKKSAQFARLADVYGSLEMVARDLNGAPSAYGQWKRADEDCMVWQQGQNDLGWLYERGKLCRVVGTYDEQRAAWKKKTKSCLARGLDRCQFMIHRSGERITSVETRIVHDGRTALWTSCPRDGEG